MGTPTSFIPSVARVCRPRLIRGSPASTFQDPQKQSCDVTPLRCQHQNFAASYQERSSQTLATHEVKHPPTSDVVQSLGAQPLKPLLEVDTRQHEQPLSQEHIENLISSLPLVRFLRSKSSLPGTGTGSAYKESRLHGSMHPDARPVHLVSGSLMGPNKLAIEPHHFCQIHPVHRIISTFYLGTHLCGHPGYIHGGLLVVLFDDIFGRCAGTVFKSGVGMTANLNTDFRKPSRTDRVYVARAEVVKLEGRKVWMTASIRCLNAFTVDGMKKRPEACKDDLSVEEEEADLVAQATALFIEPKFASSMVSLFQNS